MSPKFRVFAAMLVLPWLLIAVLSPRYVSASELNQLGAQAAPQTFPVLMGAEYFTEEGEKSSWFAYRFYPNILTVNVGDTITFKQNSGIDPHTATFMGPVKEIPGLFAAPDGPQQGPPPSKLEVNPMVLFPVGGQTYDGSAFTSSGAMAADIPGPKEYSLQFTKAGTYDFLCLVHTEQFPDGSRKPMTGRLTVQEAGNAYPMTPAQVEAQAKADIEADREIVTREEPKAMTPAVTPRQAEGGTMIYRVNAGYTGETSSQGDTLDNMRFAPKILTINQGDTVEWAVPTESGFHNVLFGEEPSLFNFEPQPAGPPKVFTPAEIFFPVGRSDHDGTGVYSAGVIRGAGDPPGPFGKSYSLTFNTPGRYEYICALHYNQGMDGTIIVEARADAPEEGISVGMPRTGAATDWLSPAIAALLLALASIITGVRMRVAAKSG